MSEVYGGFFGRHFMEGFGVFFSFLFIQFSKSVLLCVEVAVLV